MCYIDFAGAQADDNDGVDRLIVCARNVLPSIRVRQHLPACCRFISV